MNNQEIFDKTLDALRLQGVASADENSMGCCYRGPKGRKCAAGHHITDDAYTPDIEKIGITDSLHQHRGPTSVRLWAVLQASGIHQRNLALLSDLQTVHDSYMPREGDPHRDRSLRAWEEAMHRTARKFGLTYRRSA